MSKEWFGTAGNPWSWTPFAWGGRARVFESGEVRLAILSLLSEGPKHGYQLMKELEVRSGGLYRAGAGSVYPTLQQLEDEGLILAEQREGKRVYSLTDAGRAEPAKDPEAVRRIWRRAEQWEEWGQFGNPETLRRLGHALGPLTKSVWNAAAEAGRKPDGLDRISEILNRAIDELDAL